MPEKYTFFILSILAVFLCLVTGHGGPTAAATVPLPDQQVQAIQNIYRDLISLSFDFSQVTGTAGRMREGAGNGLFYRPGDKGGKPGVMRWNYTEPDIQIIVNDSKKLSIYTEKDKQLIVTPADGIQSDVTYGFFAGTRDLLDDFSAQPPGDRFLVGSSDPDLHAVQLIPKEPHGQIKTVHLWFDRNYLIKRLIMEDHFDSVTELQFTNIKLNDLPADSQETVDTILQLDLPPETEVISR